MQFHVIESIVGFVEASTLKGGDKYDKED